MASAIGRNRDALRHSARGRPLKPSQRRCPMAFPGLEKSISTPPCAMVSQPRQAYLGQRTTRTRNWRDDVQPLANILSAPVLRIVAARAVMIVDIHLDTRRCDGSDPLFLRRLMARLDRSAVSAVSVAALRLASICSTILQAEQQLILRQRLSLTAEAITLQLLDDLLQPCSPRRFCQQHRLERAGIVGKRVGRRRYFAITSRMTTSGQRDVPADSLCRSSTRLYRRRHFSYSPDALPAQSSSSADNCAAVRRMTPSLHIRPAEDALLQPLGEQAQARVVAIDQFNPVRSLSLEHVDHALKRISRHGLAHQGSKPFVAVAEVDGPGRHHHADCASRTDYKPFFKARSTTIKVFTSGPRPTPTVTPLISTSIQLAPASA